MYIICGLSCLALINIVVMLIVLNRIAYKIDFLDNHIDTINFVLWIGVIISLVLFLILAVNFYSTNPSNLNGDSKISYMETHGIDKVSDIPDEYPEKYQKELNNGGYICGQCLLFEIVIGCVITCIYFGNKKLSKKGKLNRQLSKLDKKISEIEKTYKYSNISDKDINKIVYMLKDTKGRMQKEIMLLDVEDGLKIAKKIQSNANSVNIQSDIDELEALIKLNKSDGKTENYM